MSKIFSVFQSLRLDRIFIVAMVSLLMLFNTACDRANATDTASMKDTGGSNPNRPGQVQEYKGGMNSFEDVDDTRQVDLSAVNAKAKALKDRVERNISEKSIDSPEQYVKNYRSGTPLNERIENIGDAFGQSASNVKEDAQQIGERGSKNLERNVKNFPEKVSRTIDEAKQNAKSAGEDISRGVKEPVDKAGKAFNRVGQAAQDLADDAAGSAKRTVDRAF